MAKNTTTENKAEHNRSNQEHTVSKIEKDNHAAELVVANKELAFHKGEKKKRAAELAIANIELTFQNTEKEKRAAELVIANTELRFQNDEKEKRAAELIIANKELAFQNEEKENRASELAIANTELQFQNNEKEKRAAELVIANEELAYQNLEKENRAAELVIANKELTFQNNEKEKRAAELLFANKELESFTFISSHDLQEPLRKIQTFSSRILTEEYENLSPKGKYYFERMQSSAVHMRTLINDLLAYSRTTETNRTFENCNLNAIIQEAVATLQDELFEKMAVVKIESSGEIDCIPFQIKQLLQNLITNSLKFTKPDTTPSIKIKSRHISYGSEENNPHLLYDTDYCHIAYSDNGIGFDDQHNTRIFELFQRLNDKKEYEGTGIGLTIVKKIVHNHHGSITATGNLGVGCQFDIYIPARQK